MQLPKLIADMSFDVYLNDPMETPSLNSSLVKALLTTAPRKVWENTARLNKNFVEKPRGSFDLGTAAHTLFTKVGNPLEVIDAKAFNTNVAKEARDKAYAEGKTPILIGNMAVVDEMATAALLGFSDCPEIGDLIPEAMREVTVMWSEGGCLHRARPDFYHKDSNTIIHYKTTGVSIDAASMPKYAASIGWDMTAAHYGAGFKILTGKEPKQYFAVQENTAPYLTAVYLLDNTFLEVARMRRERAIMIWCRCLRENNWPGYSRKALKLECPEWHESRLIAAKDHENDVKPSTDLLDYCRQWQAPNGPLLPYTGKGNS